MSKQLQVVVPHSLTTAEARQRLEQFSANLKQQFPGEAASIEQRWDGDQCRVSGKLRGFPVECVLRLTGSEVTATGALPLLARPFQGVVESAIRAGLQKALRG